MEILYKILIIIAIAMVLIILLCTVFNKGKKKGRQAENKVSHQLKKIGRKRKCKLINNAYLPLYKDTCEVDHILFGSFGICVIETKGISGVVSGNGRNLVHKIGSKVHSLYNPQLQNKTHIDNILYHLQKGGFKNVPVYGIVVFSANDISLETNVGIYLRDLDRNISQYKNAGCDTKELHSYFNSIRVRNPFKKLSHNFKTGAKK